MMKRCCVYHSHKIDGVKAVIETLAATFKEEEGEATATRKKKIDKVMNCH